MTMRKGAASSRPCPDGNRRRAAGARGPGWVVAERARPFAASLFCAGLVLSGGSAAAPASAGLPGPADGAVARLGPAAGLAWPPSTAQADARCEPGAPDHWALYQRLAARRPPDTAPATNATNGAAAE